MTVIYADVLFLVDFSVDLVVLVLCGYFLAYRRRPARLILAALLGGAYSVFSLWASLPPALHYLLHFAVSLLLCAVAYAPLAPRGLLCLTLAFYGAALFLGGAVNAFYSLLSAFFGGVGGGYIGARRAELFLLYATISALVLFLAGRVLTRTTRRTSVMLQIEEGGRRATVSALVDSGNLLRDPLTAQPVILVRRADLGVLLPPEIFSLLHSTGGEITLPPQKMKKVRLIPLSGIDGGRTLIGYRPDAILAYRPDREKSKQALDAILAIYEGETKDFGGHSAILPPVLCTGI